MANITQTIDSLTAGISQQPDETKIPGQVRDMTNALPDITQGLMKRPAGKFVSTLSNSTTDGKWFHYYRDENEQYIGQVAKNGVVRMWACVEVKDPNGSTIHQAGAEVTVVNGIGNNTYLTHTGTEDIQTLTLNDFTYLTNRNVITAMDPNVTEPAGNYTKEVFIELKTISYAKQYSFNVFDQDGSSNSHFTTTTTATRINVERVRSSNNYCDSNGFMVEHSPRGTAGHRCDESAGDGRDAYAPNVATRIFSVDSNKTLVDGSATGGTKSGGGVTNQNYSYAVRTYAQGGSGSGNDYVSGRKNLYFRIATTGQSVPFTTGSGETQQTTYQARYTTTYDLLHGGDGWLKGDFFYVWMKDAFYKVTVEEISTSKVQANLCLGRPQPTPFDNETTITAESILGDMRQELIDSGNFTDADITQIGIGLHIKRSSVFNASTGVGELINVVAGQVNDVGDLPSQCKDGMIVEIVNSDADEDNHYVRFNGNNGRDGEGTWQECAKPGRTIRFDYATMPVALIRTRDGNFRLTKLDDSQYTITSGGTTTTHNAPFWDDALVGDDVTNPEPDFIGRPINKMLFFRNRFIMLANEFIICSRPGDYLNFWNKSAITFIASDPINLSASAEYPAIMYDGIEVNTGLVLFTKNKQFMLTTDSDVFSPTTAKINSLSTYNFNFATNPISLGVTVGFLDNAGKNSRFYEMANIRREGQPQLIEQSAIVSRLFEHDLKTISNSRENSLILFSEDDTSTMYGYRYFDSIRDRKLASWFKWTLNGVIKYHCMQDDALFMVQENNGTRQLLKYAIKMDSETLQLAENRVHMDYLMPTSGWTYNASTGKSTKAKPAGLNGTGQIAAYDIDDTANPALTIGNYAEVTNNSGTLEIVGDWSGQDFLIGHLYEMSVTLPTIYYVTKEGDKFKADTRSSTILHRMKIGFGPVGVYETTLTRLGRVDYTDIHEVTPANQVGANTTGVFDDNILRTIPIYDRNINANLTIKSSHPTPATIHNITWEGILNNNFYTRV